MKGSTYIPLEGQRFGKLVVLEDAGRTSNGGVKWLCRCDCGELTTTASDYLRSGKKTHCGCSRANAVTEEGMIGRKFRRLLVIRRLENDGDQNVWECQCDCGNIVSVRGGNLRSGNSGSCGCWMPKTHGLSYTPEYRIWAGMKARCLNPNNNAYRYYGGRGITVHGPWIEDFEDFYNHVGPRPGPEYSLDRIDSDKGYEPGNVKWATPAEQWDNRKQINMTFDHYQHETHKTAIYPNDVEMDAVIYLAMGLASEASEVAGKVKKCIRDNGWDLTAEIKTQIAEELSDTMWYISEMSYQLNISLEQIAKYNLAKLRSRAKRGVLGGSGDHR